MKLALLLVCALIVSMGNGLGKRGRFAQPPIPTAPSPATTLTETSQVSRLATEEAKKDEMELDMELMSDSEAATDNLATQAPAPERSDEAKLEPATDKEASFGQAPATTKEESGVPATSETKEPTSTTTTASSPTKSASAMATVVTEPLQELAKDLYNGLADSVCREKCTTFLDQQILAQIEVASDIFTEKQRAQLVPWIRNILVANLGALVFSQILAIICSVALATLVSWARRATYACGSGCNRRFAAKKYQPIPETNRYQDPAATLEASVHRSDWLADFRSFRLSCRDQGEALENSIIDAQNKKFVAFMENQKAEQKRFRKSIMAQIGFHLRDVSKHI